MNRNEEAPLPQGWAIARIEQFCDVILGQSPPGKSYNASGEGLPFFQGKAEFGELYPTPVKWCSAPKKIAKRDDILISVRAPVGPTNLCITEACIGRGLAAIRPLKSIRPRFVLYALRSTQELLAAKGKGTTFEAISGNDLRCHRLPIAPLCEQDRIVAEIEKQFTRLDAGIAALSRIQARLKKYRASLLAAACEGNLVPTEADLAKAEGRDYESADLLVRNILEHRQERSLIDLPPMKKGEKKYRSPEHPAIGHLPRVPEGWAWVTLSQVAEIQGGIQKHPKRAPVRNSYPFLRVANVLRGSLDLKEIHYIELFGEELKKYQLATNDLLMVEGNGSLSEIGRMAIWNGAIENCVHQNHIIRARLLDGILAQYVASYWNSPGGSRRVSEVASSTSGLYTLSVHKVGRIPIPLPPEAEQTRIVAEIQRRLSVIDELEESTLKNKRRAERLRQSVLRRAFEGNLVPQDPKDQNVSVLLERNLIESTEAQFKETPQL